MVKANFVYFDTNNLELVEKKIVHITASNFDDKNNGGKRINNRTHL